MWVGKYGAHLKFKLEIKNEKGFIGNYLCTIFFECECF